jgi:hypothetical protein
MFMRRPKHRQSKTPQPYLDFANGTRVRVTQNLATQSGIYNGKLGTVYGFLGVGRRPRMPTLAEAAAHTDRLPIVLVQLDGGLRQDGSTWGYDGPSCVNGVPRVVPFSAAACIHSFGKGTGAVTRWQLPLEAAHASTVHLAQGLTAEDGVVVKPPTGEGQQMGLMYVALSRAKIMSAIKLLSQLTAKHITGHAPERAAVTREYARLRAMPP